MKDKIFVSIIGVIFTNLLVLQFGALRAQEELDKPSTVDVQDNQKLEGQAFFRYDISEGGTFRYRVTYRMKAWDKDKNNFLEAYSIKGILLLSIEKVGEDRRLLTRATTTLEECRFIGMDPFPIAEDECKVSFMLDPGGSITFEKEELEKNLKFTKVPVGHARVLEGLGVIFPPLPKRDQAPEDGVYKWQGSVIFFKKNIEIEESIDWKFTYKGQEENGMFVIKGLKKDALGNVIRQFKSDFNEGILQNAHMHHNRTIDGKLVAKFDMKVTLLQE